jgi:hypothetical protein
MASFFLITDNQILAKIDNRTHGAVEPASGGLERVVRSSQLIAIHILLIRNDTGSCPIPPDERESEFL